MPLSCCPLPRNITVLARAITLAQDQIHEPSLRMVLIAVGAAAQRAPLSIIACMACQVAQISLQVSPRQAANFQHSVLLQMLPADSGPLKL